MADDCLPVARIQRIARFWLAAAVAVFLTVQAAPSIAHAANYALLIGVSNYTFKDITPLKGPANDVTLMWRALGKRGFSEMTVLADGVAGGPEFPKSAGEPTRANILEAFAALGRRAKAGDLVLIYFSGHGTEQPVRNASQDPERGNLDQVMLPIDAGGYDRATGTVRNGIVDDEIGDALDKIRERGADVWVIVDACHAGSMTRGVFDGLAVRGIEPSRLGIPPAPPRAAATRGVSGKSSRFLTKPSAPSEGSLVEFFAVDSSREAIERSFDEFDRPMIGKGSDRRVGVFTYFIYRALSDGGGRIATYRDLAHHVVREMQQSQIAPPAMPTFGGALDRPLLSIGRAPPPAAWEVALNGGTVEVPAGALHGLTEKTVLKLSASPAPDAPEWAQAIVSRADPISAVAEIRGHVPSPRPPALWARVAAPGVSFALKVAEPPPQDLDAATRRFIDEAKAQAARSQQGAIDWVGAKEPADVLLRAHDGRLWLLPADGEWVREDSRRDVPKLRAHPLTPSYPVASNASVGHVADALHKIARARNMVRLAEIADPTRSSNPWNALKVSAERIVAPGDDKNPQRACPNINRLSERELQGRALDLKLPEPVYHCDLVRITVRNTGNRDVDLNISYIDARAGITKLGQDCTVTVPPGGQLVRSLWVTTWDRQKNAPDSVGREHVVITAVERKGVSQTNLCFIQEAVRGGPELRTRGGNLLPGNAGWLMNALSDAAVASSGTRGVQVPEEDDAPDAPRAGMYLVTLQVTPSPVEP